MEKRSRIIYAKDVASDSTNEQERQCQDLEHQLV